LNHTAIANAGVRCSVNESQEIKEKRSFLIYKESDIQNIIQTENRYFLLFDTMFSEDTVTPLQSTTIQIGIIRNKMIKEHDMLSQ
jgi:hypothetical protein